jgi:hypothetical protein
VCGRADSIDLFHWDECNAPCCFSHVGSIDQQDQIRGKFSQFACGIFGGVSTFDNSQMLQIDYTQIQEADNEHPCCVIAAHFIADTDDGNTAIYPLIQQAV